jgi:allantoinase
MNPDLIVRSRRVVFPDGMRSATLAILAGKIVSVLPIDAPAHGSRELDFGDLIVMPGLVDTHVHINEPGRAHWEGFDTATRAAAAGGVTTLIEMPLNSIPATISAAALEEKYHSAEGRVWVDVGFWGGVVPGNAGQLERLFAAGAFGFKCFLVPSGVPEFQHVAEPDLRTALPILARMKAVLLVHAEAPQPIAEAERKTSALPPARYSTWLRSRPRAAENDAIALLTRLAREFNTRVHVVHLSSAEALACIHNAQREGVPITAETCPHYLTIAAEEIADGATQFKCAPPIRARANQEQLWEGLASGVVTMVVSDHSPCPPELKTLASGDFRQAWGGIASVELGLPVMWTAASERGFAPADLARWMCAAPAQLAGLQHRKGAIAAGYDADLVIWDPDETFCVETGRLHQRHKLTPYAEKQLRGKVKSTVVRGKVVYDNGDFVSGPKGSVLRRGVA